MQCNIDARGRAHRLIMGIVLVLLGGTLVVLWAAPTGQVVAWVVAVACLLTGAFGIFQGWAGWCAVRAMGFKTKT